MSKPQELYIEKDGECTLWICPIIEFEGREGGILYVYNRLNEYEIQKSEYDRYLIVDCHCEISAFND